VRSFELATFRIQEPRSSRLSWPVVAYDYDPFANDADAVAQVDQLALDARIGKSHARFVYDLAAGVDGTMNYVEVAGLICSDREFYLISGHQFVGRVYADLLENAGVDSVMELRNRKPENLLQKLTEVAAEHGVKRIPRPEEVQDWVAQAKQMERAVHH